MWGARIRTLIARAWITLALVESAWLAYPLVRARVLALENTPAARRRRRRSRHGARLLRLPRSARRRRRGQPGLAQGLRAGLLGCGLRRPRAQRRGALALDRGGRDPASHRAPDQRVLLPSPGDQDG